MCLGDRTIQFVARCIETPVKLPLVLGYQILCFLQLSSLFCQLRLQLFVALVDGSGLCCLFPGAFRPGDGRCLLRYRQVVQFVRHKIQLSLEIVDGCVGH